MGLRVRNWKAIHIPESALGSRAAKFRPTDEKPGLMIHSISFNFLNWGILENFIHFINFDDTWITVISVLRGKGWGEVTEATEIHSKCVTVHNCRPIIPGNPIPQGPPPCPFHHPHHTLNRQVVLVAQWLCGKLTLLASAPGRVT